jgi:simple sugar transport system permease protein
VAPFSLVTALIFAALSLLVPGRFLSVRKFRLHVLSRFPRSGSSPIAMMGAMISGGIDLSAVGIANLSEILCESVSAGTMRPRGPEEPGRRSSYGLRGHLPRRRSGVRSLERTPRDQGGHSSHPRHAGPPMQLFWASPSTQPEETGLYGFPTPFSTLGNGYTSSPCPFPWCSSPWQCFSWECSCGRTFLRLLPSIWWEQPHGRKVRLAEQRVRSS